MFNLNDDGDNRLCAQCGGKFQCAIAQGHSQCWCFEYPTVIPNAELVEGAQTCLCPACLRAKLVEQAIHLFELDDDYDSDERWSN